MSPSTARARYPYEEYRRFEESTDAKHEWVDGEILAMAGGTPEHAALAAALIAEFSKAPAGVPCTVFTSDLRVRVGATGLATYPDATVICGELRRDPEDRNAAANPAVIVEVSSQSTEAYDAGEKFEHYARIPELREYVLVSHRRRHVELRSRREDGWVTTEWGAGETLHLETPAITISVDELYDRAPITRSIE